MRKPPNPKLERLMKAYVQNDYQQRPLALRKEMAAIRKEQLQSLPLALRKQVQ